MLPPAWPGGVRAAKVLRRNLPSPQELGLRSHVCVSSGGLLPGWGWRTEDASTAVKAPREASAALQLWRAVGLVSWALCGSDDVGAGLRKDLGPRGPPGCQAWWVAPGGPRSPLWWRGVRLPLGSWGQWPPVWLRYQFRPPAEVAWIWRWLQAWGCLAPGAGQIAAAVAAGHTPGADDQSQL